MTSGRCTDKSPIVEGLGASGSFGSENGMLGTTGGGENGPGEWKHNGHNFTYLPKHHPVTSDSTDTSSLTLTFDSYVVEKVFREDWITPVFYVRFNLEHESPHGGGSL